MDSMDDKKSIESVFTQVRNTKVEVSPYMKSRVLAHWREERVQGKKLFWWRIFAAGSFASLMIAVVVGFGLYERLNANGVVQQAYVIHVDFDQNDQVMVAKAEIELPQGVHFVASDKSLRAERKLTLPVQVRSVGKGKLPFVVASESAGEKEIVIHLLNSRNEVVKKQVLQFKFAKQDGLSVF